MQNMYILKIVVRPNDECGSKRPCVLTVKASNETIARRKAIEYIHVEGMLVSYFVSVQRLQTKES